MTRGLTQVDEQPSASKASEDKLRRDWSSAPARRPRAPRPRSRSTAWALRAAAIAERRHALHSQLAPTRGAGDRCWRQRGLRGHCESGRWEPRCGLPAVGGWVQALPRRARAAAVHALAWLCPVDVRASGSLGAAGCCAADAGARVAHAASCQFVAVVRLHRRRVAHDFALFGAVGLVLECHPRRCSPPSRVCSRREARSCVRTSPERS